MTRCPGRDADHSRPIGHRARYVRTTSHALLPMEGEINGHGARLESQAALRGIEPISRLFLHVRKLRAEVILRRDSNRRQPAFSGAKRWGAKRHRTISRLCGAKHMDWQPQWWFTDLVSMVLWQILRKRVGEAASLRGRNRSGVWPGLGGLRNMGAGGGNRTLMSRSPRDFENNARQWLTR